MSVSHGVLPCPLTTADLNEAPDLGATGVRKLIAMLGGVAESRIRAIPEESGTGSARC